MTISADGPSADGPSAHGPSAHGGGREPRNRGMALDLEWVGSVRIRGEVVARRAARLAGARLSGDREAARLLRAIRLMDLTTLSADDTPERVRRLCARARRPLPRALVRRLGAEGIRITPASVCVHPALVKVAARALEGTEIRVAAAAGGFPHGLTLLSQKVGEIRASVAEGAHEVDVVVTRFPLLEGNWKGVYDEVRACREACGDARLKVILGTGALGSSGTVARAGRVCLMAGADFLKTSTGHEAVNATLPVGVILAGQIRAYERRTGYRAGLKPAGGIRRWGQALRWVLLAEEELGAPWLGPGLFRLGASSLLADIERRLTERFPGGTGPPSPRIADLYRAMDPEA